MKSWTFLNWLPNNSFSFTEYRSTHTYTHTHTLDQRTGRPRLYCEAAGALTGFSRYSRGARRSRWRSVSLSARVRVQNLVTPTEDECSLYGSQKPDVSTRITRYKWRALEAFEVVRFTRRARTLLLKIVSRRRWATGSHKARGVRAQVDLYTNLMKTRTKICRMQLIHTQARARA